MDIYLDKHYLAINKKHTHLYSFAHTHMYTPISSRTKQHPLRLESLLPCLIQLAF